MAGRVEALRLRPLDADAEDEAAVEETELTGWAEPLSAGWETVDASSLAMTAAAGSGRCPTELSDTEGADNDRRPPPRHQ